MNILQGNITKITTDGQLSLVKLTSHGCALTTVVVDTPVTSPYLKINDPVNILFKETEVILARPFSENISLTNKIPCTVRSVLCEGLLCKVAMDFNGVTIHALLTHEAWDSLDMAAADEVVAMINTIEVSLSGHA